LRGQDTKSLPKTKSPWLFTGGKAGCRGRTRSPCLDNDPDCFCLWANVVAGAGYEVPA